MCKKILVIYKSATGYTKQYAHWLAQALSCEAMELKDVRLELLRQQDVILFGGGLYAGGVSGMPRLVKWYPELRDKEMILFTCGLADPRDPKNVQHIEEGIAKAIPAGMYAQMKQFHLRGGIDYSKLSPVHRSMMWMLCQTMKSRGYHSLSGDDKLMVDTYGKKVDFSDRTTVTPIVEYVLGEKPV